MKNERQQKKNRESNNKGRDGGWGKKQLWDEQTED